MDLYSSNVDLNSLSVDELVQRLEQMEKSNEQIKREN
jgi:chromosome segregation ATPase